MNEQDNLVTVFMNRFGLDKASAKYVVQRAETLAKSLNEPDRKPNDYALAKYLNERVIAIFALVADQRNTPDTTAINRSYVLLVNELKKLYARNPELQKLSQHICWQAFDHVEYIHNDLWEYTNNSNNDYGQSHNAEVNRLCISSGKETPDFTPEIKKIVDEANKSVTAFLAELDEDEPTQYKDWFIPQYTFTYGTDGSMLVNGIKGVMKVKKTQAGSASARLLEQATAKPNELFKPNLGNYSRNLSTTLSGIGFSGTLRDLFFPQVSEDRGLLYRPVVSRADADAQHIDTAKLDDKLKKLGAEVEQKGITLDDIPF